MAANVLEASALCCLHTQVALDNLAATPAGRVEDKGFMAALMSAENKRGFEQITNSVTDSRRRPAAGQTPTTVEVKIRKPSCATVSTSAADLCTEGTATADPYDYIDAAVTHVVSLSGSMSKAEFDNLCDGPDQRRVMILQDFADDLMKAMNITMQTDAYGQLGDYYDSVASTGATTLDIPIIGTSGILNTAAFARISSEFRQQGFRGRPIMVGGEKLAVAQDVRRMAGTGTSLNLDPNAAFNSVQAFYDYDIDATVNGLQTTTGESYAITWIPGSIQMLEWYRNAPGSIFEEFAQHRAETTLTINGVTFDYFLRYRECDHEWDFTLQKWFDIWAIPDELYTCNYGNGRVLWGLTCGEMDCDIFGASS